MDFNFTMLDPSQNATNLSTAISDILQSTVSSAVVLMCNDASTPCGGSQADYCLNGGLCCFTYGRNRCTCTAGFTGERCQNREDSDDLTKLFFVEAVRNQRERVQQIEISAVISMLVGILALVSIVILAFILVRKKLVLRKDHQDSLNRHITGIQDELDGMPTVSKLIQLTRLSKMFQQSAREAVRTTLLSTDVRRIVVSPSPNVACLPRWSSAPSSLAAGTVPGQGSDEIDAAPMTSPLLEPSVRRKLQTVISLDVGTLWRSHEHEQQQQQASAATDANEMKTTRF